LLSDKYKSRFLSLIISAPFGIAGYAILVAGNNHTSPGLRYFATYLISTACYLCTGTNIAWLSSNCAPDGKRAASVGILLSLTNIGGVVAGQIFQTSGAPAFVLGHSWSLGCLAVAWCGWWVVLYMYKRRERQKDRDLAEGKTVPEHKLSDRAPDFRYQF
jgi:MFS family permease